MTRRPEPQGVVRGAPHRLYLRKYCDRTHVRHAFVIVRCSGKFSVASAMLRVIRFLRCSP